MSDHAEVLYTSTGLDSRKLAIWTFIGSECMFFATLLSNESPLLSTGQRRRLILARALCRRPRLLLLDEVTANLDPASEAELVQALLRFPAAKVFVTHSRHVLPFADRVLTVRDGALVDARPETAEAA